MDILILFKGALLQRFELSARFGSAITEAEASGEGSTSTRVAIFGRPGRCGGNVSTR